MQDKSEDIQKADRSGNYYRYRIVFIAILVVVVIWLGTRLVIAAGNIISESQKIAAVMNLISRTYVEKPDLKRLSEGAIEGMLKRLDPHSMYIPPKEQEKIAERDIGVFEGIGISFVIQNELITVIAPITGTPAERLGIRSGDRVIEIDGVSAYGITNDEVFKKLRGPKGTTVKVRVLRDGVPDPIDFTIVRDKIPIHSIWTSFMLNDSTGYIIISQFTQTTTMELDKILDKLETEGMTQLILDLRNNGGGRLDQAVWVADRFIPGGHTIVSKVGRNGAYDSTYTSSEAVTHNLFDMIVLINGGSASASEIVAGAIQDLDRGLIVGTNSFGKGLVQLPYPLRDGGVIRLSTAHWFTPAGRLVQRPYDKGRGEYYAVRYRDPDEVTEDGERESFKTLGGRTVYASSGISPAVEIESGKITGATAKLLSDRTINEFARTVMLPGFEASDQGFASFRDNFEVTDDDLNDLLELSKEKDFEYPPELLDKDRDYLKNQIKAELAQLIWSNRDNYYIIRTKFDAVVQEAEKLFDEAQKISSVWR